MMLHYLEAGWRPALQILILAFGLYWAFRFMRGTRGWPVFIGFMIVLMTVAVLTWVLQLEVLRWILTTSVAVLVVAVLVIFQPELRKMFAELGHLPMFTTVHEQREAIEVIIQTVERLSEVRIGALIAIEQTVVLSEAVESGVFVDCEATPEMLETIFFPNNAIHDGGVIIKGDRITHAACIFPLTQRQDLSKSLGTRHRAAIGLSEETDALVVVVSEETGSISYAQRGQLNRGVSVEHLRSLLTSQLVPRMRTRSWIEWIRDHSRPRARSPAVEHPPPPVERSGITPEPPA
jgi:diadenylate cyclase